MTQGGKIVEGVFAINKPQFLSSAQVLRDLQSHFGRSQLFAPALSAESERRNAEKPFLQKRRRNKGPVKVKIGHGGTLDPLATGVLIAGIGKGTKQLPAFLDCTKSYEAVVLFGVATDTYDRVGKVIGRAPYGQITRQKVEEALEAFRGKITQRPPIFSALRVDGKRLYQYAREGVKVPREIQTRPMGVESLELVEWWEGGKHTFGWPVEEAKAQDKFVAEQILKLNAGTSNAELNEEVGGGPETEGEKIDQSTLPKQEASTPDIKVGDHPTVTITTTTTTDLNSISSSSSKRKRDDLDSDDDLIFDAKHPQTRRKTSDFAPLMSGGLPDPATVDGPSSNPTVDDNSHQPDPPTTPPPAGETNPDCTRGTSLRSFHPGPALMPAPAPAPAARLRMTVSTGFYVRSLCHDLGMALGSLGIMFELVRTRQAQFELGKGNVFEYADLEKGEEVWAPRVEALLDDWWKENGRGSGKAGPEGKGDWEAVVEVEDGKEKDGKWGEDDSSSRW
ncbi:MAG: hypothetical protein M1816_007117 [Peltula sp. TS41687]|nr:MAG: hypothetical protein M1816_007117 [Peltula sp. TS41687]